MAGTNFVQWNPSQANQENDTQYAADSQRVGGAPDGTPFPSKTGNKLFYQVSTGITALMQMMAAKGFTCNDTNIGTLASVLAAIQTTADQKSALQVVSYSPSASFNASEANGFQMTLSGNANSCTIGGWSPGQIITFIIIQDSIGGHTFTIPGVNQWQGALNTAPNSVSAFQIIGRSDGTLWALNQELLVIPYVQQGTGIGQGSNVVKIGWSSGSRLKATVDTTDLGNIVFDTQLAPTTTAALNAASAAAAAQASANSVGSSLSTLATHLTGLMNSNGWLQVPLGAGGNCLIQWGVTGDFDGSASVSFPVVFPTGCLIAFGTDNFGGSSRIVSTVGFNASSATFQKDGTGNGIYWIAIGH